MNIILYRGVILTVGVSTWVSSSQAVELDDAFACLLLCAPGGIIIPGREGFWKVRWTPNCWCPPGGNPRAKAHPFQGRKLINTQRMSIPRAETNQHPGDARESTSRATMSLGRGKERDEEVGRGSCHKGIWIIFPKGPTFNLQIVAIRNLNLKFNW